MGPWPARRAAETFERALGYVRAHAHAESRELLERLLDPLHPDSGAVAGSPGIQLLPLVVHAALRCDDRPALPLAAAMTLFARGIDILDDLADGDWPSTWHGYTADQVNLAAVDLVFALPLLGVASLGAPPETLIAMQRSLAVGYLQASAGQQLDLALTNARKVSSDDVERCAVAKSGALVAMQTRLGAELAGAPAETVEAYAAFGRNLGTAMSLSSDCDDVFVAERSRDLTTGTRTLPIALHLEILPPGEHDAFVELLDSARREAPARARVRRALLDAGMLRACVLIVATYCTRARRLLAELAPAAPAGAALAGMIDGAQLGLSPT